MTEIKWMPDVPDEYREASESLLKEYLWLVPAWCQTLRVQNNVGAKGGEAASTETRPEYRHARITLTPWFLECDAGARRQIVIHELLHIGLAAAADVFANVLAATENEPFRDLAEEEWRKASEAGIQDLAHAIAGREED